MTARSLLRAASCSSAKERHSRASSRVLGLHLRLLTPQQTGGRPLDDVGARVRLRQIKAASLQSTHIFHK
jgi:hypothetical protein